MFFKLKNKDIEIETLTDRGSVMNQINCLTLDKITYSAKAVDSVTLLTLSLQDIQDIMLRRKDLRKRIDKVIKEQSESQYKIMIDYTRNVFYSRELMRQKWDKQYGGQDADYVKSKMGKVHINLFKTGIERLKQYLTFQR